MSYFDENSGHLQLREGTSPNSGLRPGQVGALHAIAAHFIARHEPAVVSLPTGYGKTAVITATCFLLRSRRVLVIAPTNALRGQCARAFRGLDTLRRLKTIPETDALPDPRVALIDERITSLDRWNAIDQADVVVCTPQSASPEIEGVIAPPEGFFDLVIMDEGHHSAARTWSAFIRAMPKARHVLFSATPFRRDRRQLPGRLIFYYSLRQAAAENAFGKVAFCPVVLPDDALQDEKDNALVAKAIEVFRNDADAGLQHRLLARTERIADADSVAALYVKAGLKVESVSSRKTRAQIAEVEQKLVDGDLDGVVCVDMFGEGYDFPKFKIAVLHSAHRSLVPTLQFIGRFARTNDEHTGDATFIAVPQAVDSESAELYREGVDWDVLLADVTEAKQQISIKDHETLQAFSQTAQAAADYEQVNPGAFRLSQHIAVYKAVQPPDFESPPEALRSLQVTNSWKSEDGYTYLILAKSVKAPAWYRDEHLIDANHECFLIRYFPDSQLIFITATERSERIYSEILELFFGGAVQTLGFDRIRRVLNGMTEQEFYSIGIRSKSPTATAESYRIMAGSSADRNVRDSDAANFSQGHFMGKGQVGGESEIIGASAGGRIWSNGKLSIPDLLDWMSALHQRMTAQQINIGRSGLDLLSFGETLDRIPPSTCLADWPKDAYRDNPHALYGDGALLIRTCILDLSVTNISVSRDGMSLTFDIGDEGGVAIIRYSLNAVPHYSVLNNDIRLRVSAAEGEFDSIEEWLEENGLVFFTKELDSFSHGTLQRRPARVGLSRDTLIPRDWADCEINVEFDLGNPARRTVQRVLQDDLIANPDNTFIIFDHRSGEAADFIVGRALPGGRLSVALYHCKAAGGGVSGERVDYIYELAGQSVKSARFQRKDELLRHIERRTQQRVGRGHSPFLLGNRNDALELIRQHAPIDISVSVYAVQPGLSAALLVENVQLLLAAANDSLRAQSVELHWILSN
jgi:superfamily II DNA or RNA helicase